MSMKKLTKNQMIDKILSVEAVAGNAELVAFLEHEKELNSNRNSKKSSKTSQENAIVLDMLIEELAKFDKPVSITTLISQSDVVKNWQLENGNAISCPKATALLTSVKEGACEEPRVRRIEGKNRTVTWEVL